MSIEGWRSLTCGCGNAHFQQAFTLIWHEQNGMVPKPDGWVCTGCNRRSDNAKMIAGVKAKALQTKIDELTAQL